MSLKVSKKENQSERNGNENGVKMRRNAIEK
jgi:hypothetical protein